MENWHDFEKNAAVYFERLHQVFAVRFTDSGKAERVVKRDSHKVQQWTEVCVRPVFLGIRPAVCIASVCLHTAGRMHRISLRMHTAGRMHSIGHFMTVYAITDTKKGEQGLRLLIFKLPQYWYEWYCSCILLFILTATRLLREIARKISVEFSRYKTPLDSASWVS